MTNRLFLATLSSLCIQEDLSVFLLSGKHFGVELEFDTLLRQKSLESFPVINVSLSLFERMDNLRDLLIDTSTADASQELNHGHLSTQPTPDTAHLEPNNPSTNDHELFRNFLQIKCSR
jgi:hypothetical protein